MVVTVNLFNCRYFLIKSELTDFGHNFRAFISGFQDYDGHNRDNLDGQGAIF